MFLIFALATVPVALSQLGSRLDRATVLFVGWFGPRGIASVLYQLPVANLLGLEGYERVLAVIVPTVLLSVLQHDLSTVPPARRYGASRDRPD